MDAITTIAPTHTTSRTIATGLLAYIMLRGPFPTVTTQGSTILPFKPSNSRNFSSFFPPLQTLVSRADFQQITASLMSLHNEHKPKLIFLDHCNWACYQAKQKYIFELLAYPAFTDPVSICPTDSTPCTPVACPANRYSAQLL